MTHGELHYTVHKYPFLIADEVAVHLPRDARILKVACQPNVPGDLQLWAHIDRHSPMVTRVLRVYSTGDPMPGEPGKYIDTVMMNGGAAVWHIYDLGEVR